MSPPPIEVVELPFGLCAIYVLREKPTPPQPVDPTPQLLEQAPWLLIPEEDACPF
ncbi:MAG: hypothetical protein M3P93_00080 [Actinomycetota bacterium]|nr:hypothetical protein [Actinomycetota bacterium]